MSVNDKFLWRALRRVAYVHRFMYAIGLGPLVGRIILLLTTTGRRTGKQHVTPLQYEEIDGLIYIGAGRGRRADWYRNLLANPQVHVRVKRRSFAALAEPVSDPQRIADFLQIRLQRHPRMVGAMMRMHSLPPNPTRRQLTRLAKELAVVVLHPVGERR